MKIVRWNPRMNRMRYYNEFDRSGGWRNMYRGLPLDVTENEDGYIVKATVAGINPEDVDITIEENVLTIKGEYAQESESEDVNYLMRERCAGNFGRSIRFPMDVNADAIDASYEHGVLTLNVPKVEEVKPKRVAIKVG
jgi:HSP20 family protein